MILRGVLPLSNMPDGLYREHILEHARHPRNKGLHDGGRVWREVNAACGDVMTLQIGAYDVRWDGTGCALSTAAASLLTGMPEGWHLTDEAFLHALGIEVTSGRLDCALLPLRALRKAYDA